MTDKTKPMGFLTAMADFFGRKPGQNLNEFAAELKALDTKDREYFRIGLEQNGYAINTPVVS